MDSNRREGAGINGYHAFLVLDGSGSMSEAENTSGKPKHKAVAEMVQGLINELHDNAAISDTQLTITCYDSKNVQDVRLQDYDVKLDVHYNQSSTDSWDPLVNHGGATPVGRALAFARELAERWVNSAQGLQVNRAVIYLLSDGMTYPDTEPNGMAEKEKIRDFNATQEKAQAQGGFKGRIRLATIGYYQHAPGANAEEDKGRTLLKELPDNPNAYFSRGIR